MKKPDWIKISAFSLAVALAPSAAAQDVHRARPIARGATAADDPQLPVENALRWGYSQGYRNYPSGFGGLYGDGRYPGNVISNGKDRRLLQP
jgi:hypothetical protein